MVDTVPKESERLKAFELFLTASLAGKPRSHRSIAASLGVSPNTIRRWAETDGWDQKVHAQLSQSAQTAEATQNAIKRLVRRGLLDGLTELRRISTQGSKEADRIGAVKALVDIAIRIDAVTAAAGAGESEKDDLTFDDTLEEQPVGHELPEPDPGPVPEEEASEADPAGERGPESV